MIERSDRSRAHRRMPRQDIGHADCDPRLLGGARDERCRPPGIHGVAGRVGDADHCIAIAVGALRELFAEVEGGGPKEETDLHLDTLSVLDVGFQERGGQRRMMAPSITANKSLTTKPNRPTSTRS